MYVKANASFSRNREEVGGPQRGPRQSNGERVPRIRNGVAEAKHQETIGPQYASHFAKRVRKTRGISIGDLCILSPTH